MAVALGTSRSVCLVEWIKFITGLDLRETWWSWWWLSELKSMFWKIADWIKEINFYLGVKKACFEDLLKITEYDETVPGTGRRHLKQVIQLRIFNNRINWHLVPPDVIIWERSNIAYVDSLPTMHNPNPVMSKQFRQTQIEFSCTLKEAVALL